MVSADMVLLLLDAASPEIEWVNGGMFEDLYPVARDNCHAFDDKDQRVKPEHGCERLDWLATGATGEDSYCKLTRIEYIQLLQGL